MDYNLIGTFCVNWITLHDLCRLDSAICSHQYRSDFLLALRGQRLPAISKSKTECDLLRVRDARTREDKNVLPHLYQWLAAKELIPTSFEFMGKLCPCYGQPFMRTILRNVEELKLLGDSKVDHAFFKSIVSAECRMLHSIQLCLNSLQITPKYIESLVTNNTSLQFIKYYGSKWVTCELLTIISRRCKALKSLELISVGQACFVDPGDMFWHFHNLRELSICNYNMDENVTDVCMGIIHGSPHLESLAIETHYNEAILGRIVSTVPVPQLVHMTLREPPGDTITSASMIARFLRNSSTLTSFRAGRSVVDGPAVEADNCIFGQLLGSEAPMCPALEYLDLSRRIHSVSIEKVMVICGFFPNLKEFDVIIKAPQIEQVLLNESFPNIKFHWSSSCI